MIGSLFLPVWTVNQEIARGDTVVAEPCNVYLIALSLYPTRFTVCAAVLLVLAAFLALWVVLKRRMWAWLPAVLWQAGVLGVFFFLLARYGHRIGGHRIAVSGWIAALLGGACVFAAYVTERRRRHAPPLDVSAFD